MKQMLICIYEISFACHLEKPLSASEELKSTLLDKYLKPSNCLIDFSLALKL